MSKNRLHISFLLGNISCPGGTERVTSSIANALVDIGYKVTIISLLGDTPFFVFDKRIKILIINKTYLRYYTVVLSHFKLRKLLKQVGPDILINVGTELSTYMPIALPAKTKFISWEHFIYHRNIKSLRARLGLFLAKKMSSAIVVLTNQDAKNWNTEKVIVISNPLSYTTECYPDYFKKRAIAVGNLIDVKGFDLLVKSWINVRDHHPDATLHIYGQGIRYNFLMELICSYNLKDVVFIHEPSKDIQTEMLRSSIFIMSSACESFGLVLTEAMSCGLPVVAFDCDYGPREILEDGVDSFIVPLGDLGQLSSKINTLLRDADLRLKMGSAAKVNSHKYDKNTIIKEWVNLFNSLNFSHE